MPRFSALAFGACLALAALAPAQTVKYGPEPGQWAAERYQACDDRVCYPPESVALEWRFPYEGLVRERAPAELQRKVP